LTHFLRLRDLCDRSAGVAVSEGRGAL